MKKKYFDVGAKKNGFKRGIVVEMVQKEVHKVIGWPILPWLRILLFTQLAKLKYFDSLMLKKATREINAKYIKEQ